jgi:hypothetical protein
MRRRRTVCDEVRRPFRIESAPAKQLKRKMRECSMLFWPALEISMALSAPGSWPAMGRPITRASSASPR